MTAPITFQISFVAFGSWKTLMTSLTLRPRISLSSTILKPPCDWLRI